MMSVSQSARRGVAYAHCFLFHRKIFASSLFYGFSALLHITKKRIIFFNIL